MTKLRIIYIIVITILTAAFLSCEDDYDKENPLVAKWRYKKYLAEVETNDSIATSIITQDILKINKQKHHIYQYGFMTDSIFVLYDTDSDYKASGKYYQKADTIFFNQADKNYWAIQTQKDYFNIYYKNVSEAYSIDSLRALGVNNPETIEIKKAWLLIEFKRI